MVKKPVSLFRLIPRGFWYLIGIGLLAFLLVPGAYLSQERGPGLCVSDSIADWGAFGDYFGGMLNPFLSFLAFVAVLATVRIQIIELEESRVDSRESNEALRRQTSIMEAQLEEAREQNRIKEARAALFAAIDWRVNIISTYEAGSFAGMQRIQRGFDNFGHSWSEYGKTRNASYREDVYAKARELKRYITWYSTFRRIYEENQGDRDAIFKEVRLSIRNGMSEEEVICLNVISTHVQGDFSFIFSEADVESIHWILDTK